MDVDVASITAVGTAIATVILSIAPLVRAVKEPKYADRRFSDQPNGLDQVADQLVTATADQGNLTISHIKATTTPG